MRTVDLIRKKRDGGTLTGDEIAHLVRGYTRGEIPDYQISSFLMAVLWRGLSDDEVLRFTEEMMRTGEVVDLSWIPGPKVDKHSTGGVGDKTSLVLAPLAAAAGVRVPMVSGRGLGHTGGTLDKLESIPGFNVNLSLSQYKNVLRDVGLVMIGQTKEIAPADKKLYALRDVTGTVESYGLISASIMSKKMAEGIDALVLDVKTGDGAFMKTLEDSRRLAETMVRIGHGMGKKMRALITDMNQPLGRMVGNALEVIECLETLRGRGPEDLTTLSVELAAQMVVLGGFASHMEHARALMRDLIESGAGLEKFREVIAEQGGDPAVVDDYSCLPAAAHKYELAADTSGFVRSLAAESVGLASMILGAGREQVDSKIDPGVGIELHKKVGDRVERGERLCTVHYNGAERLSEAVFLLVSAYRFSEEPPPVRTLIYEVI
ncbi:MAG: thymidine phosphorylase [Acidobacteria bacterium]|nr:thymidine phosphorylase [Acidobacteriota bacterium]